MGNLVPVIDLEGNIPPQTAWGVPKPLISQEQRDLALTVGKFGRSAGRYNLLSQRDVFGLSAAQATHELEAMQKIVDGWRDFYARMGVSKDDIAYLE